MLKLPKLFKKKGKSEIEAEEEDESTTKRREVLEKIKGMMESGALPAEPENVIGADKEKSQVDFGSNEGQAKREKVKTRKDDEEEDDFFDVDD